MNEMRSYWFDSLLKIANPVLLSLADGELKKKLPNRFYGASDRTSFGMLEAFGRTFCGFAPVLDTFPRSEDEEATVGNYRDILTACLDNATRPGSPDYMNFGQNGGSQPLVDAAFLAHGLLRAGSFSHDLPRELKKQIIDALIITRKIIPASCNWILFSCMVEAGIHRLGGEYDVLRVMYGIRQYMQWYKGDGIYGDGQVLHMDYYNSFVIIPMMIDILNEFQDDIGELAAVRPTVMKRAVRTAELLERLINRDGTYPYIGRSITYRFGAFQLLSQAMLQHFSPPSLSPASVRCGLTAVIRRVLESEIFDESGWLLHGVYGFQPDLAEEYICTGSLYLCCAVFLPLGLPEGDPFWASPDEKWTSLRITDGENVIRDHAIQS